MILLTDEERLSECLDLMGDALCLAFELESSEGKAFAWMLDQAIKYGTVIKNKDCPLSATSNYEEYEQELYEKHIKKRSKKKLTLVKNTTEKQPDIKE